MTVGIGDGHGREQRLRVRHERLAIQIGGRRELDDLAEVHHGDAVGDVLDDREIVRDEQVGEPAVALQILQQVDHLRLHRDVERRHRLVADDEARLDGERARDADALALAAGELVRIARRVLGAQADFLEQLAARARRPRRLRRACGS